LGDFMSVILAGTTLTNGLVLESDTAGNLVIKTGAAGVTAMTISASQVVSFVNPPVGIAGLPTMNIVSGTTQAATASNHYVLTNAATTTVTLPASPAAGDVVWVTVANGLSTNVIARNGKKINELEEDMTIDAAYAGIQLRFSGDTEGWVFT
jgi:hypothetical protein